MLTVTICLAGILGNILAILVLQSKAMKSCFNNLLTALNISERSTDLILTNLYYLFI